MDDFWRLVWEQNVQTIIVLSPLDDQVIFAKLITFEVCLRKLLGRCEPWIDEASRVSLAVD